MTTYKGSCHCGSVRFEIDADIDHVRVCDCSICVKRGALNHRVPRNSLRLLTHWHDLILYQWGSLTAKDYFCATCGILPFRRPSDPTPQELLEGVQPFDGWAVNVRCLEGVDIDALPIKRIHGSTIRLGTPPDACDDLARVRAAPEPVLTMLRSVGAVLFDLGGVVFEIDFGRAFARWALYAGEELENIRARFSPDEFYARHERGEINAAEYFESLRSSLRIDLTDAQFADGWSAIFLDEIPGVAQLLQSAQARVPLYAFTNSNATHMAVWASRYAATLKSFRRVFLSSELGMRKPEPEAFATIARTIGVPLDRILFFDDTKENIEGAVAVGMRAVHVESARGAAQAIATALHDVLLPVVPHGDV